MVLLKIKEVKRKKSEIVADSEQDFQGITGCMSKRDPWFSSDFSCTLTLKDPPSPRRQGLLLSAF